jgi:hypothetical protein
MVIAIITARIIAVIIVLPVRIMMISVTVAIAIAITIIWITAPIRIVWPTIGKSIAIIRITERHAERPSRLIIERIVVIEIAIRIERIVKSSDP